MATSRRRKPAKKALSQSAVNTMQEVWLAGLGALAIAQREGRRQFESLVKQGLDIENQLRKLATPQFERAAQSMMAAAEEMSGRAQSTWKEMQKLMAGQVERVMSAGLGAVGTPDVRALMKRVEETMSNVQSIAKWPNPMGWGEAGGREPRTAAGKSAKRKSTKRKAAKRKSVKRKTRAARAPAA